MGLGVEGRGKGEERGGVGGGRSGGAWWGGVERGGVVKLSFNFSKNLGSAG